MNTDDPRLTAYALGELDPPEQAEIEALLQSDPEAAREVEEIRATAAHFRTHLATEPAPALAPEQQRTILAVANSDPAKRDADRRKIVPISKARRRVWIPLAIAACAMLMLAAHSFLYRELHVPARLQASANSAAEGAATFSVSTDLDAPAAPAPLPTAVAPSATPPPLIVTSGSLVATAGSTSITLDPSAGRKADSLAEGDASKTMREPLTRHSGRFENSAGVESTPTSFGLRPEAPGIPAPTSAPATTTAAALQPTGRLFKAGTGTVTPGSSNTYSGATTANAGRVTVAGPQSRGKNDMTLALRDAPAPQAAAKPAPTVRGDRVAVAQREAAEQSATSSKGTQFKMEVDRSLAMKAAPAAPARSTPVTAAANPVPAADKDSSELARNKSTLDRIFPSGPTSSLTGPKEQPLDETRMALKASAQPAPAKLANASVTAPAGLSGEVTAEKKLEEAPAPVPPTDPQAAPPLPSAPESLFTLPVYEPTGTDAYDLVTDNAFLDVAGNPLSTFSIDVDTASYANVRRFLTGGQLPPKGAVRIEELVNYFTYDYPQPKKDEPFSVQMEVAACPWTPEHRLLRVGLKARELDPETRPQANLVFLIDVSGSMMPENRLPLVKQSLRLLVDQLGPQDTVAIAVYAGASGTVLEPTNDKEKIRAALDRLQAGGSTNGAAGIRLAYDLAKKRFDKAKTNRVILATDGDFNVGTTSQSELIDLITAKAKSGVFLTVLGFGYGNLKDSTLEKLADKGNGNYGYIDSIAEGRKVLVEQMAGTLFTVAKDVKIQIEFNPVQVAGYRLIGYENRLLAKEDFNDDTKDAGEIGAGHTVTALYELVPAGTGIPGAQKVTSVDPLKYQFPTAPFAAPAVDVASKSKVGVLPGDDKAAGEMLTLKLRWKAPDGDVSTKREFPLTDSGLAWEKSSRDFRWAAAVASFGMILRDSPYKGQANWAATRELAVEGQGEKADGHRIEFLDLIGKAEALAR